MTNDGHAAALARTHDTRATDRREPAINRWVIRVVRGADEGTVALSAAEPIGIGSAPGNHLVLHDPEVSRHHCELVVTARGLIARDLGSTNGSFVDGVKVMTAHVRSGSVITLGSTTLRVQATSNGCAEPAPAADRFGRMLGASVSMRRVFSMLDRIAPSESTVLLEGETGTGKTLIAEMVHCKSARQRGPFVVVDCSTIPPTLIESELFGHEKGAFTSAHAARVGAFEAARTGTLFLDEVGELPLDMQPKLLRALEERVIKRVGSTETIRLDVRVIAATNRDLREEVNRAAFRADLYYRLNIVKLRVPPLRERPDDIPLLATAFFQQFSGSEDRPPDELLLELARRPWLGNVRELRSAVERIVLLGDDAESESGCVDTPNIHDHRRTLDLARSFRDSKDLVVAEFERWYVSELLATHDGNLSRAARAVHMDRNHLRDLARRYDISLARTRT